jgi:hypothetical protein
MVKYEIKDIVLDKSDLLFKLLLYLRVNQDKKPGVSKQKLADFLRSEELSSRMTTFGIIEKLVDEKMLLDNKVMNYTSNLRINPDYDFDDLIENVLRSHTEELYLKLAKLIQFTKREETELTLRQLTQFGKLFAFLTDVAQGEHKKMHKESERLRRLPPIMANEVETEVRHLHENKKDKAKSKEEKAKLVQ